VSLPGMESQRFLRPPHRFWLPQHQRSILCEQFYHEAHRSSLSGAAEVALPPLTVAVRDLSDKHGNITMANNACITVMAHGFEHCGTAYHGAADKPVTQVQSRLYVFCQAGQRSTVGKTPYTVMCTSGERSVHGLVTAGRNNHEYKRFLSNRQLQKRSVCVYTCDKHVMPTTIQLPLTSQRCWRR
jgi:hypothetical protein